MSEFVDRHTLLNDATAIDAAEILSHLAGDLAYGRIEVDGGRITVDGPVDLTVDVDLSAAEVSLTITLHLHRPAGVSPLLYRELVDPGG